MHLANKKNLQKFGKELLGCEYTEENLNELISECTTGFVRSGNYSHISHDRAAHLDRIGKILGTLGTEGNVEPDFQYCNTGDSYTLTILYYDGELYIGDWGTVMEEYESEME